MLLNTFKEYLIDDGKSKSTIDNYLRTLNLYMNWLIESTGTEFKKMHRSNAREFISYLRNVKKESPKTVNNKTSALIKFNEFLIEVNHQTETAVSKKDMLKIQSQYANFATVNKKDVEQFRQMILNEEKSKRNYALVTLLSYCGLRISEALDIEMDSFNLKTGEVVVKGKGDKTRTVYMNSKVIEALNEWIKERKEKKIDSDYLFCSNRGSALTRSVVNKMFNKYGKEKGITPHTLRHFFCSNAIEAGLSIHEVANAAGHSNIATTLIYTNPTREKLKSKMELL